jgi:hypothetical protein
MRVVQRPRALGHIGLLARENGLREGWITGGARMFPSRRRLHV